MPATYEPITTITTSGNQATVTFSSISQAYTDLVIIGSTRRVITGSGDAGWAITFNGDTSTSYSVNMIYATGSTAGSARANNNNNTFYTASVGDGVFNANLVNIMNYSNSTTYKTVLTRAQVFGNGSPSDDSRTFINTWRSTAAITSITLSPSIGFFNGSVITLYGIKAA